MGIHHQVTQKSLDLAAFNTKAEEAGQLSDLHSLGRVEDQALWVLMFAKDKVSVPCLSAAEISTVLADVFEVSADEGAVRMAMNRAKGKVHVKAHGRTKKFSIMKKGREAVYSAGKDTVIIVDPARPCQAISKIAKLLGAFSGAVSICDPYLDKRTLEVVNMMPQTCVIRLLSNPPRDGQAFVRYYRAYKQERENVDIRTIPPGQIHDRYILADQFVYIFGHSLNAVGTKQSLVIKLTGDVKRQLQEWFGGTWANATPL